MVAGWHWRSPVTRLAPIILVTAYCCKSSVGLTEMSFAIRSVVIRARRQLRQSHTETIGNSNRVEIHCAGGIACMSLRANSLEFDLLSEIYCSAYESKVRRLTAYVAARGAESR